MPFKAKKNTPINTSSLDALGKSVVDLAKYAEDEFAQVATSLQDTEPDVIWNTVPPKPRRGTTAYADGTNWNPGFGEGPYFYNNAGQWIPEFGSSAITGAGPAVIAARNQLFTISGTYTPSLGMVYCVVEAVGGGGGGGSAGNAATTNSIGGGGGGSGGYSRSILTATQIGASQTVTIGAGGNGGAVGINNGANGTDTSFGALVIAKGGSGGKFGGTGQVGAGGAGGIPGTGDVTGAGAPGSTGGWNTSRSTVGIIVQAGVGGSSSFGGGAVNTGAGGSTAVNGANATNYGSGGSGGYYDAFATGAAGGNGSGGICLVTEFCTTTTLTWDPGFLAFTTLSGGNLVATSGVSTGVGGVRAITTGGFRGAGKFYFEATFTTIHSASTAHTGFGIGLVTSSSINGMQSSATTGSMVYLDGSIWINGSSVGAIGSTPAAGDTIACAIDLTARKIWWKKANSPAGNWNNNPAADPVAGVGGLTFPNTSFGAIPFATFGGTGGVTGDVITANFGGSAFVGAVPAGYSSGLWTY